MKKLIFLTICTFLMMVGVAWGDGSSFQGISFKDFSPAFRFEVVTAGADTFQLPIYNGGTYDCHVVWGDGSESDVTSYDDADANHSYAGAGTYNVEITGTITGWRFNNGGDKTLIHDISEWGPLIPLGSSTFYGCTNLTVSATDELDLTGTTSLANIFKNCTSLTALDASSWDVSSVTSFSSAFRDASNLVTISAAGWDTGSVTTFLSAFQNCSSLSTLDVSGWDTALVESLAATFYGCTSLTDPAIDNWDISSLTVASTMMTNGKALSTSVYDATLIAWEAQDPNDSVTISFGTSTYTVGGDAATARANLVLATGSGGYGWTITDGGTAP